MRKFPILTGYGKCSKIMNSLLLKIVVIRGGMNKILI